MSDAGLANFKDCQKLTVLALGDTQVSDAGLALFKDCNGLTELFLPNTQVSDAGSALFKACKNLRRLTLQGTKVTAAGIEELEATLPGCKIEGKPGGTALRVYEGHVGWVCRLALTPDGRQIVSAGNFLRIWASRRVRKCGASPRGPAGGGCPFPPTASASCAATMTAPSGCTTWRPGRNW